ncbi:uncharacterized protein LOC117169026 isoform X2 [Belonocnema kinseyi]|uniref:uncharacterized protein LOC117169026 isoform X2 n=1 Tax=Belonocnema kinseyi TaxID=2817044 RepID=UPI00143D1845|nr:uncharacterized protein LOC117169026 isoform X2 [Belonocnema kinseyi]
MMNLVVNKIRILWLLLNLFGFLQSQRQEYYWIPYELETAQTKSSPGYVILPENRIKSSQYSSNPSRDFHNNYEFVPNSGQYIQGLNNYNYNNYHPRKTELNKDSYYNYYANDKSYEARKSWERKENAPQLYFRELDDLKVQPRKTANNTLAKPAAAIKRTANEKIPSRKLSKEEIKRVARQTQKQRPGFFWTLFRVAFETVNDTRSAIGQISELLSNGIAPDPTTKKPGTSSMIIQTTTVKNDITNATDNSSTTTTAAPFVLTRSGLQGIIRRNVKGLVRLFNIEWRDAINQSQVTTREFQRDLGNSIGSFLRDNPDAY